MVTLVTSAKPLPVIVTLVPPLSGPLVGLTAVTMSAGGEIELSQPEVTTGAKTLQAIAIVPTEALGAWSIELSWCHLTDRA
jgi:hypothetical protein